MDASNIQTAPVDANSISMSAIDIFSLISSISSIALAIIAIILSIVFYRMSSDQSQLSVKASQDIEASVKRLEQLFDKLYSDTFSMMKETVTDMRNHIWKNPQFGKNEFNDDVDKDGSESERIDIKEEIKNQIREALNALNLPTDKQKETEETVKEIVNGILKRANRTEIRRALPTQAILSVIGRNQPITIKELIHKTGIAEETLVLNYLFPLRSDGKILWEGSAGSISNDSLIYLASTPNENSIKNWNGLD